MSGAGAPVERLADVAAAEWLLAHDRGMTEVEAQDFEKWLARSPTHAEAWARANDLWSSFEQESDPSIESMRVSARAMRPTILFAPPARMAAAVVLVTCLGIGGLIWRQFRNPSNTGELAENSAPFTHYGAAGALTQVKLSDGTHVLLDVGSEIEVRQTESRRDVRLTAGQAFFTVAHDTRRPFVVEARDDVITDVGTAFAVTLRPNSTSVVLASGRVRVARKARAVETTDLAPGQQYFEKDGQPGVITSVDLDSRLAWRTGQMELDDTPLAEAVAELNRHAKTQVLVGDAKAAALKLSGRYRLDDPAGFAQSITAIYPVKVRTRGDGGLEIVSK